MSCLPGDIGLTLPQFPHLIIPIDSANPTYAYGTQFNGTVSPNMATIFNFDIPASAANQDCQLIFLFPTQDILETSAYTFSGSGEIGFSMLEAPATQDTTWNNAPDVVKDLGSLTVAPGNSYTVAKMGCPAGNTVAFQLKGCGDDDTCLSWFQDWNPSP